MPLPWWTSQSTISTRVQAAIERVRGGNGDRIEQAESHASGRGGVMPRRPGQDETRASSAVECRVDGGYARAGGERGDVDRSWADGGIGVQPAAALRGELPYAGDIARIVDARQHLVGRGGERDFGATREQIQALQCRIDRDEPARVFRVTPGVVLAERSTSGRAPCGPAQIAGQAAVSSWAARRRCGTISRGVRAMGVTGATPA